jgi:hypothetical protein
MRRIGDDVMVNVKIFTTRRMTLTEASEFMVKMKHTAGWSIPAEPKDGETYEVLRTKDPSGDTVTKARITTERH